VLSNNFPNKEIFFIVFIYKETKQLDLAVYSPNYMIVVNSFNHMELWKYSFNVIHFC
ncbi:uncharacterized protein METZ01_LOCUS388587, partial [marine metagenome]